MENSYHYQVIERAILYIKTHAKRQPSLSEIAEAQGMSASHFQRVFSLWVGVSPKKYLEYLTLAEAKSALLKRMGTINAAYSSGLTGTGRLYDLVLKWEAVTPGEYAANGEGVVFKWSKIDTRFGNAIAALRGEKLAGLEFSDDHAVLQKRWPKAEFLHAPNELTAVEFALNSLNGEIALSLQGTAFQIQVWRALLTIPEGALSTYGDLASAIGRPNAARAVGTAIGKNPMALLIPCHRVIRGDGHLGGYHWGIDRKVSLLAFEGARRDEVSV